MQGKMKSKLHFSMDEQHQTTLNFNAVNVKSPIFPETQRLNKEDPIVLRILKERNSRSQTSLNTGTFNNIPNQVTDPFSQFTITPLHSDKKVLMEQVQKEKDNLSNEKDDFYREK